jgi:predicted anti-sigma-YlaC factor YlaD
MTDDQQVHLPRELVARYVGGDVAISAESEWSLEVHLENCSACRALLSATVAERAPQVRVLVDAGLRTLLPALADSRPAKRRRVRAWLVTWTAPATVPWLVGALLIAVVAAVLGRLVPAPRDTGLLLLLSPVIPVFGVAAAWSKGLDPMYELVTATARAGLVLLLRRTVAVLVVVLPVLAAASVLVGVSPLLWLLPCLACVLTSLALGSLIGVERAALVVGGAWLAAFAPTMVVIARPPGELGSWTVPVWVGLAALAGGLLLLRGRTFTQLSNVRTTMWNGQ